MKTNKEVKSLKDVVKIKRNEELKELENLSQDLDKIAHSPSRITLEEFETYFLPYIINEVEKDETNNFIFVNNFLEKTNRSWFREIEVVDPKGNVLFILPPLAVDVDIKENSDVVVNKIVTKYYNMIKNGYYNSEKELAEGLANILSNLKVDEEKYKKYIVEYNKIFISYKDRFLKAYKRRKGIPLEKETSNKKPNTITEEDDIFDY